MIDKQPAATRDLAKRALTWVVAAARPLKPTELAIAVEMTPRPKKADLHAQGGYYGNALQAAARGGYEAMVQMLSEKGADVNAPDGKYGNALQAVAACGNGNIVQLLLEKGADVNAQGGVYGNALHATAAMGNGNIVRHLSANADDVNTQARYYRVAGGRLGTEVAQMLRDAGAVE